MRKSSSAGTHRLLAIAAALALAACNGRWPPIYSVGGTVSGLTGSGLVLQNNGGDDLTIATNDTTFEFSTPIAYGSNYAVTVLTQPMGQSCALANATGTATAQVGDITLTCTDVQFTRFDGHHMIVSDERVARDPQTAAPLYFVFVDNTSAAGPDGSHEHPYSTLSSAETNSAPANILYVFPGDGTTTGMDAGITLKADQKFWGAGISHAIQTSDGSVTIPAQASSAPKVTNTAGDGITLATDNDISGIVLQNVAGRSIFGADPGSVRINSNTIDHNTSISNAPLIITATGGPLSAVVDNNTLSDNTTGAMQFSLSDAESTLSITNNTISGNGSGAIGPFGSAIFIDPNGTSSGSCNLLLSHNTIADNTGSALYAFNGGFDDFQVTAADNTITGNGGAGFVFANAANTFTLTATNNTISGGGDNGITTGGGVIMTTVHMTLSDNQITGNTNFATGIVLSHEGTDLSFVATDNEIGGNEGTGILLYSSNSIANVAVSIRNNTIGDNQNLGSNAAGGIDLEQFTNLSGALDDNTLSNNAAPDVLVSSVEPAPSVCLEMSGNESDSGYTLSSGTGTFNLAPTNAASVNTGTITTIGTVSAVPSCPP